VALVQLLDWRHYSHFGPPAPGVLCGTTTPLGSHAEVPVHKVCAELWNARHSGESRFVLRPAQGLQDNRPRLTCTSTWRPL